jgi:hypothetical protein
VSRRPKPGREEAIARVRAGTLFTAWQIEQAFDCSHATARDWLTIGRGRQNTRQKHRPARRPGDPVAFRCPACLRIVAGPVCSCGATINPILAVEVSHG